MTSAFSTAAPSGAAREVGRKQPQEMRSSCETLGYGQEFPLPSGAGGPGSLCGAFVEPCSGKIGRVLCPSSEVKRSRQGRWERRVWLPIEGVSGVAKKALELAVGRELPGVRGVRESGICPSSAGVPGALVVVLERSWAPDVQA